MGSRFLTILTGSNLPKIRQAREPEPSIINEKTVADFTRVVEQTDILDRAGSALGYAPEIRRSARHQYPQYIFAALAGLVEARSRRHSGGAAIFSFSSVQVLRTSAVISVQFSIWRKMRLASSR